MFCRKCGIKLNAGEKTCRNCGASVELAEYCGGFWGLVGEEKKTDVTVPSAQKETPVREPVKEKPPVKETAVAVPTPKTRKTNSAGGKKKAALWQLISLVLLILLLLQMGKANRCSLAAEKIQTQYESLKVLCETIEKQNEALNEKIDALFRDMEQLAVDISDVKDVVERKEEMTEPATEEVWDIEETDVPEENNG